MKQYYVEITKTNYTGTIGMITKADGPKAAARKVMALKNIPMKKIEHIKVRLMAN